MRTATGVLALMGMPIIAHAHPGDGVAYFVAYTYPWVLLASAYWGLTFIFQKKLAGNWSPAAIPVIALAFAMEAYSIYLSGLLFFSFPVVLGRSHGSSFPVFIVCLSAVLIVVQCWLILLPGNKDVHQNDSASKGPLLVARVTAPILFFCPFILLILRVRQKTPNLVPSFDFWIVAAIMIGWYAYRSTLDWRQAATYTAKSFTASTFKAMLPLAVYLFLSAGYMFFEKETAYHSNPGARGYIPH